MTGGLRGRVRQIRLLASLGLRARPKMAPLAIAPVFPLTSGLSYVSMRWLLSGLLEDDTARVVAAATAFTIAWAVSAVVGQLSVNARVTVGEAMGYEVDRRVIDAVTAIPDVEDLERPEYLDHLEVVRTQREDIIQAPRAAGALVDAAGGVLVSLLLLLTVRPGLVLLVLAGAPSLVLTSRAQAIVNRATLATAARSRRALHLFDVATSVGASKEIRVFGLRDELLHRYRQDWWSADREQFRSEMKAAAMKTVAWLLAAAAFGVALMSMIDGVRRGDVTTGDIFIVLGVMTLVISQLTGATAGIGDVRRSLDVAARVVWLIERANRAAERQRRLTAAVPDRLERGIELDHVSFAYPGTLEPALADISLHIPAGTVVAVVGENGAGKSTLIKVLFGLYQPTAGRVEIDGTDLREVPAERWRERTTACFQDFARYHLTAGEGIGMGDLPRASEEPALLAAAHRASASDVLAQLPSSLDTMLGSTFNGQDLSGGQWQKLAIARAMMRDEPLLIALDEPTSALDPLAEHELFEHYADAAHQVARRTGAVTILISHRFSTVRIADLIVVLERGRIAEVGSHDELVRNEGLYAELYRLQARHYRD